MVYNWFAFFVIADKKNKILNKRKTLNVSKIGRKRLIWILKDLILKMYIIHSCLPLKIFFNSQKIFIKLSSITFYGLKLLKTIQIIRIDIYLVKKLKKFCLSFF